MSSRVESSYLYVCSYVCTWVQSRSLTPPPLLPGLIPIHGGRNSVSVRELWIGTMHIWNPSRRSAEILEAW